MKKKQIKQIVKSVANFIHTIIKKVLRWARFHKPEDFFRSSYITNQDKYYFEVKDRVGLGNNDAKRSWAISGRV